MDTDKLNQAIITALDDSKAKDIVSIDVDKISDIAERIIVTTGTSSRHVKAIAEKLLAYCKQNQIEVLSTEGLNNSEWVLADLGDVVVHIMQIEARELYQLEKLWGDIGQ